MRTTSVLLSRPSGKVITSFLACLFIAWNIQFILALHEEQRKLEHNAELLAKTSKLNGAIFVLEKVLHYPSALRYPIAREAIWETYYQDYEKAIGEVIAMDIQYSIIGADIREMSHSVSTAKTVHVQIVDSLVAGNQIHTLQLKMVADLDQAIYTGQRASAVLQGYQRYISLELNSLWRWFMAVISVWCLLAIGLVILLNRVQALQRKRQKAEEELRISEQNLQTLFDHSLHGFLLLGRDKKVQGFNTIISAIAYHATGNTLERGKLVDERILPDQIDRFNLSFEQALNGQHSTFESQVVDANSNVTEYEVDFNPVYDNAGQMVSVCVTTLDITDRKHSQKKLQQSEERFRTLVSQSSDVVSLLDRNGKVLYQSPASNRVLGYGELDLIGRNAFEVVHPEDAIIVQQAFAECLESPGMLINVEFRAFRKDGAVVYLECVGQNLLDNVAVQAIVLNTRDLTRRKHIELQLIAAKERAEEMNRLKSSFLANMSHEIRTPMTAILGFASVLKEEISPQEREEYAETIERSGKRLLETINSILDLAKIEANQIEPDNREIDLHSEIQNVVSLLSPIAQTKNLRLSFTRYDQDLFSTTDPKFLAQILTNLVGNGIKFTEEGGISITVRYERFFEQGYAAIEVRDTGIGISPEFVPFIFDEFKQESNGWGRQYEGSGLGLTICKKLANLLGAEINVVSTPGVGTVFTLRLIAERRSVQDRLRKTEMQPHRQLPYGARVLLVEDNPDNAMMIGHFLRGICDLLHLSTGEAAYEIASREYFDLAIVDINLGIGMTGIELAELLRQHPLTVDMPIIALTAYAMKSDEEAALAAGCSKYISKPVTKEDLTSAVTYFLNSQDVLHRK